MSKIDKDTLITSDVPTSSVSVNLPGRVIRMATTLDLLFVLAAVLAFSFGWGPLLLSTGGFLKKRKKETTRRTNLV